MYTIVCTLPRKRTFDRFTPCFISSEHPTNVSAIAIVTTVAKVSVRLRLRFVAVSRTT